MPKTAPKPAAQKFTKIAFVASPTEEAGLAAERLKARYGQVAETEAEVIVALGGDGLMLETLHRHMGRRIPIYGMNRCPRVLHPFAGVRWSSPETLADTVANLAGARVALGATLSDVDTAADLVRLGAVAARVILPRRA